jgi:PTH1 family peptidyl-tRNA hydrolase
VKAIVGLGNPGPKYEGTRHNIGFAVANELARRASIAFGSAPMEALVARWRRADPSGSPSGAAAMDDVLIVKPLTFMNNSGQAIGALLHYFKMDVGDLLVVIDDVQLPVGRLRIRAQGSAGGHNGLKSTIAHVGEDFSRLRIGVGRGDSRRDLADHVLARFDSSEAAEVERMTVRAADAAQLFITAGIAAVMNAYNGGDPATID